MGSTSINADVRHLAGAPTREVTLPAADLPAHQPPLLDRVGDQVRERTWLPLGGAFLGAAATGVLGARAGLGLLRLGPASMGGALLGGALAIAAGMAATRPATAAADRPGVPVADPRVRADEDLRVTTYNVHGAQGPQGEMFSSEQELQRLAESIRRERPDVVLLQELERFSVGASYVETLDELARRLGATGAVFTPRGTLATGRQQGTGVLTFNGIQIADARGIVNEDPFGNGVARRLRSGAGGAVRGIRQELSGTKKEDAGLPDYFPRVTSDVMLVTPAGNHVRVMSGHYNGPRGDFDYQPHQVEPVAALVDDWEGPTIWGGDFNARSASPGGRRERELLGAVGLTDAFVAAGIEPGDLARASFGTVPRPDLDRIYGTDHFRVRGVQVAPFPRDEPAPSDHHPVTAELQLRRER